MAVPTDRRYAETHEWCKISDDVAEVGLTQYAADQLTDITFVALPAAGEQVQAGQPFGEIESVKSAGDVYAPVSGEVVEANEAVVEDPGQVNADPFEAAWMIRIKLADPSEADSLMDAAAYDAMTDE
jgi:glycine cleavage system H protein